MKLYILVISNCRFAPHTLGAPAIRGTPNPEKTLYDFELGHNLGVGPVSNHCVQVSLL